MLWLVFRLGLNLGETWYTCIIYISTLNLQKKKKTAPLPFFIFLALFPPSSTFVFFSTNEYDGRRWLRGPKGSFKANIRYAYYYSFLNVLVPIMKKKTLDYKKILVG